jgi:hypothetical protein
MRIGKYQKHELQESRKLVRKTHQKTWWTTRWHRMWLQSAIGLHCKEVETQYLDSCACTWQQTLFQVYLESPSPKTEHSEKMIRTSPALAASILSQPPITLGECNYMFVKLSPWQGQVCRASESTEETKQPNQGLMEVESVPVKWQQTN